MHVLGDTPGPQLGHESTSRTSTPIASAKNHRRKAQSQRKRQCQGHRSILQISAVAPPEQPQKEENNTGQITQTGIRRDPSEAAPFFRIQPVKQLIQAVVHVDLRVPLGNSPQSLSGNPAEVSSEPQLIPSPAVD